jgi:hypothetical protein
MRVFASSLSGSVLAIEVTEGESIASLKRKILAAADLPHCGACVIWNGVILDDDDEQTVRGCHIGNDDVLQWIARTNPTRTVPMSRVIVEGLLSPQRSQLDRSRGSCCGVPNCHARRCERKAFQTAD